MNTTADIGGAAPTRTARPRPTEGSHGRGEGPDANFEPFSRYVAKDLFEKSGIPLLMSALAGHDRRGHGRRTVRGRAVTEGGQQKRNRDQRVVHPGDGLLSAISSVAGFRGSLECICTLVKVAAMADLNSAEPARFDGEEARFRAVKNKKYREGELLVIRSERPQHGPWMREALATREPGALRFNSFVSETRTGVHYAHS